LKRQGRARRKSNDEWEIRYARDRNRQEAKIKEATMDKLDAVLLYFAVEHMRASQAFDKTCADLHVDDKRVARLLVLLKQLDESAAGLEMLPEPELNEIVSSAIRVCGFADRIEARDVFAIVLDAIRNASSNPGGGSSGGQGIALCDA
jgi:hypothetical protein